jgi:hypothetical protein
MGNVLLARGGGQRPCPRAAARTRRAAGGRGRGPTGPRGVEIAGAEVRRAAAVVHVEAREHHPMIDPMIDRRDRAHVARDAAGGRSAAAGTPPQEGAVGRPSPSPVSPSSSPVVELPASLVGAPPAQME